MNERRTAVSRSHRRAFICAVPSVAVAVTAGCTGGYLAADGESPPARADDRVAGEWAMHHGDPGRSRAVEAGGVTSNPEPAWSRSQPGKVLGEPAIADSLVSVSTHSGSVVHYEAATGDRYTESAAANVGTPTVTAAAVYGQLSGSEQPGPFGAVDPSNGERHWERSVDGVVRSPALRDGTLYAASVADPYVYAFDASTGDRQWRFESTGEPNLVSLAGESLLVATGPYLVRIDADQGDRVGEVREFDGPLGVPRATGDGIVVPVENELLGLNRSGDERWRAGPFESMKSLAVAPGAVYVGFGDGVSARDVETGTEQWRADDLPESDDLVVTDEVIYAAGDGRLSGVDRAAGDVLWTRSFDRRITGLAAVPDWLFVLVTPSDSENSRDEGQIHALTSR